MRLICTLQGLLRPAEPGCGRTASTPTAQALLFSADPALAAQFEGETWSGERDPRGGAARDAVILFNDGKPVGGEAGEAPRADERGRPNTSVVTAVAG